MKMLQRIMKHHLDYVFGKQKIETWNGESIPGEEDYQRLRNVENLLVTIPWGRNNGRQVERVLAHLAIQKCEVKGLVITDARDHFVKAYYAIERIKGKK